MAITISRLWPKLTIWCRPNEIDQTINEHCQRKLNRKLSKTQPFNLNLISSSKKEMLQLKCILYGIELVSFFLLNI